MKTKRTILALALGLTAGTTAVAADWSGPYAGLNVSHASGGERLTSDENGYPMTHKIKGQSVGLFFGANSQKNKLVYGWEIDGAISGQDGTGDWDGYPVSTEVVADGHLRVRLGYDAGNFMPFVSGGVALMYAKNTFDDSSSYDSESFKDARVGFSMGLGADIRVSRDMFVRAEYIYDRYATASFGAYDSISDSVFAALENDTYRLGFGMKF